MSASSRSHPHQRLGHDRNPRSTIHLDHPRRKNPAQSTTPHPTHRCRTAGGARTAAWTTVSTATSATTRCRVTTPQTPQINELRRSTCRTGPSCGLISNRVSRQCFTRLRIGRAQDPTRPRAKHARGHERVIPWKTGHKSSISDAWPNCASFCCQQSHLPHCGGDF